MNNKAIALLLSLSLGVGVISLAAYASKDNGNKDIQQSVQATGENILTLDYRSGGNCTSETGTYNVGSGSIEMKKHTYKEGEQDVDNGPTYSNYHYLVYNYSSKKDGNGNRSIFELTDVVVTKMVLTATTSYYARKTNYVVDGGTPQTGTWSDAVMTIDDIEVRNTLDIYNAELNNYGTRITIINIEYANSGAYDTVNTFCTNCMHPEVPFDNEGKGKCISFNWYSTAKAQVTSFSEEELKIFKTNSHFAQYHERYLAWADANHDTSPYEGNGIVLSNNMNDINKNNGNIGLLITSIASFSVTLLSLSLLIYANRKERE